jgi:hypothetical protein
LQIANGLQKYVCRSWANETIVNVLPKDMEQNTFLTQNTAINEAINDRDTGFKEKLAKVPWRRGLVVSTLLVKQWIVRSHPTRVYVWWQFFTKKNENGKI